MKTNNSELTQAIAAAAKVAFTSVMEENEEETFFTFALWTNDDGFENRGDSARVV